MTLKANGPAIRRKRILTGWNLRKFAVAAGISPAYLSRVENGLQDNVGPERLVRIANTLRVPVEEIVIERTPENVA